MHDGVFKEESWAKLERPERLKHLDPEGTLRSIGLKEGFRFADFGSGTGVFVRAALTLVGVRGTVYAVERSETLIQKMVESLGTVPENLRILRTDLMAMRWETEPVHVGLLCHVAHELPDLNGFLTLAREAVMPGGSLVIIEWLEQEETTGPPLKVRIGPERMAKALTDAGWIPSPAEPLGERFYLMAAQRGAGGTSPVL